MLKLERLRIEKMCVWQCYFYINSDLIAGISLFLAKKAATGC